MTMYGAVEQDERAATPRRAWGLVLAAGLIAAFGYLAPEATTSIKPAFLPVMPGIADGAALTTYAPTAAPANSTNSTNSTNVTTAEPTPSPMGCDEGSLDICVLTSSCPGIDSGEVKRAPARRIGFWAPRTGRGGAAGAAWIFRGRVAATPRVPRGYSAGGVAAAPRVPRGYSAGGRVRLRSDVRL